MKVGPSRVRSRGPQIRDVARSAEPLDDAAISDLTLPALPVESFEHCSRPPVIHVGNCWCRGCPTTKLLAEASQSEHLPPR